jgi:AcrR family transcriptional regulator
MPTTPRQHDESAAPSDTPVDSATSGRPGRTAPAAGPVWIRPTPQKAERLTLEAILTAAITLADAEGLDAVSVRRVAGELNARPMSLYSFFTRKDDLIELMVDQVMGEMLLEWMPDDWREALRAIARRTRDVGMAHPWLMVALSARPSIGPNSVRHMEQSLAAIASLGLDSTRARSLLLAVDVFTIGYATMAMAEQEMRRRDGLTESEWRASTESYFARLVDSKGFPHLADMGSPDLLRRDDGGDAFEEGFNWLLAGFADSLAAAGKRGGPASAAL